ncbi:unnamed protein product [Cyclocybe aegerita]|uniref:Uncharacterized protein n=1 Tax=Cyclocybe aegerita TaxID=1973307 RepID=A0A8S0WDU5_CYCAE|nr:unnamed protein product [Cyclocybe aegerita]
MITHSKKAPLPEKSADTFYSAPPSITLTSSPYPSPPDAFIANFDRYKPSYCTLHPDHTPNLNNSVISKILATFCSYLPLDDENQHLKCLLNPSGQIFDSQPFISPTAIVHDDLPQQQTSQQLTLLHPPLPPFTNSQNVWKCFIPKYLSPAKDPLLKNVSGRHETVLTSLVHSFATIMPRNLFVLGIKGL